MVALERINVHERWEEKTTVSYIFFQCTSFKMTKKHICLLKIVKNSRTRFKLSLFE